MKNFFFSFADEYNNNEKEALPQDILRLLKASGHGDYGGRGLHGLGNFETIEILISAFDFKLKVKRWPLIKSDSKVIFTSFTKIKH